MKRFFNKTIVWVLIISLLSLIFRIFFLDLMEFKSDEATTVYQTIQFFNHPNFIPRGLISGTGVYNFPLFNYLMIVLGVWSQDPLILSWTIALINSLLVSVFFLLVRRYYGLLTAIFASFILAFSPWGVIFSRKIWAQDLIFIFLIPFFYVLHELVLFKNTKVVLPMFLLLALLVQLHGSGVFLLVATLIALLILHIKVEFKTAVSGILIGLIPSIPYILFQINSFPICPDCETFLKYQHSLHTFDFQNLLRPFQIISGLGFHFVLGKNYGDFSTVYPLLDLLKYIFASGFPVILMGVLLIILKNPRYLFLVAYFITIPFLYLITKTSAYMHYFVIMIPVSILLFANLISNIYFFVHSRFLKTLVISYFVLFLTSNVLFLIFFYRYLSFKKQIEGDYGPIYSFTKNLIEEETKGYSYLTYYPQLKSYAYIYAASNNLHAKLGEYFLAKGAVDLARKEFQK